MLRSGREKVGIKKFKKATAFIDYSKTIDNVYENLEDPNPTKERKVLIVFDDMMTDIEANKKLTRIFTELLLWGRILKISVAFMLQPYFEIPKTIRLNATIILSWKFLTKEKFNNNFKSYVWQGI